AFAALPQLLFILLDASGNSGISYVYLVCDFTIYFACLIYAALLGVEQIRRLPLPNAQRLASAAVAVTGVAMLVVAATLGQPMVARFGVQTWHPLHADLELARAVGQKLLPKKATVLDDEADTWYTTGVARIYSAWIDFGAQSDLSQLNVPAYLR